jgi:hypothetical protein
MADLMDNLTDMVKDGELADALEKWIDELFSSFSSDALAPDSATNPLSMAAAELNAEGNSAPLDNNQSDKRPQLEKDEILDDAAALVI